MFSLSLQRLNKQNNTQNDSEYKSKQLRETFERAEVIGQWIKQIEKNNQDVRIFLQRLEDMKYNQKGHFLKEKF